MSKAPDTTTTKQTTQLPEYVDNAYKDITARAGAISNTAYQPYNGQRLANFSGDTQNAFQGVRDMSAAGVPQGMTDAQNTMGGIAAYQPGQITTQGIPQMDVQGYMNPYTNNVLDVQKQRAMQNFQEQQQGRDTQAVQAGAFGGDRRFVQNSLAQRDLNNQLNDINATGLNTAYNTATSLYEQDQGRNLQGQTANEDARRLGANLGLDAAKSQGMMAQSAHDMQRQDIQSLSDVGAKEQQRTQAGLDLAYQDFNRQTNYPQQQLSNYAQIMQGQPTQNTTTTATTGPAPDFLSSLIGAGSAAGGIASLWPLLFGA